MSTHHLNPNKGEMTMARRKKPSPSKKKIDTTFIIGKPGADPIMMVDGVVIPNVTDMRLLRKVAVAYLGFNDPRKSDEEMVELMTLKAIEQDLVDSSEFTVIRGN
jgi:hypothetical protein